jgi:transcriptional regulator with XRE-family HTH domain
MPASRDTSLVKLLAKNVKRYRKQLGLSQEGLAFDCEIDRTYISKLERGIANPSLLILTQLAKVLKVDVVDLLKKS